jgi:hypothetical protein
VGRVFPSFSFSSALSLGVRAIGPLPAVWALAACSAQTQHASCPGCDPYSPFKDASSSPAGAQPEGGTSDDGGGASMAPGMPAPATDGGAEGVAEATAAPPPPPPSSYDVAKAYAGDYAVQIRFRKVVTVGTLGTFNALATIYGNVQIADDAANKKLTMTASPCHIELSGKGTGLLNGAVLLVPDIVMTTTKLDPVPFGAVNAGGSVSWSVPEIHGPIGWKWASPSDAIPMSSSDSRVFDQDMDGNPGVTVNVATGSVYSNVPVDLFKTARADKLYLAIRQVTQIAATVTDCDHASGNVTIPQLPSGSGNFGINSHVIGCEIAGGTTSCTTMQTQFVDATQPTFTPGTSTFASARLAAGATCATVRAQLP